LKPFAKPIISPRDLRPFAKIPTVVRDIACPIFGVDSKFYHLVERRIRPITNPRHKPMLDRVDMDVIQMTRKIVLVANGVLPITSLPDAALAFGGTTV
jgi:hypothetical protein